mmetsp:Transcript_52413/g.119530  ORF Transcript_52413/g.119530 Transcript_52413/m.119530 type:complete len:235 (+) Transcript_52413:105-809(+)
MPILPDAQQQQKSKEWLAYFQYLGALRAPQTPTPVRCLLPGLVMAPFEARARGLPVAISVFSFPAASATPPLTCFSAWLSAPLTSASSFSSSCTLASSARTFERSAPASPPSEDLPFLAAPSCTARHLLAKLSVQMVSPTWAGVGATLQIMSTLDFPAKLSWSKKVSLELRYGTCTFGPAPPALELSAPALWWPKAFTTSPSAESDLLICWASLRRSPSAWVLATRSEPARSTK